MDPDLFIGLQIYEIVDIENPKLLFEIPIEKSLSQFKYYF